MLNQLKPRKFIEIHTQKGIDIRLSYLKLPLFQAEIVRYWQFHWIQSYTK